jgi:hypothetical protein
MFKFEVPENDQSVYEITTESGNRYLIRCPGTASSDDADSVYAFHCFDGKEQLVMLFNLDRIASFTRRPDLPTGALCPRCMYDLNSSQFGEGLLGAQPLLLE